jgi:hypothetical protein
MEKPEINLSLENAPENPVEIIFREGAALKPEPEEKPEKIEISGPVNTVVTYIKNRLSKEELCKDKSLIYNLSSGVLQFREKEGYRSGSVISGGMKKNDFLEKFLINEESSFDSISLTKVIKNNIFLFEDKAAAVSIITYLKNLRAKGEVEIIQENDSRGTSSNGVNKKFKLKGFPESFTLSCPIHEGSEPVEISVELCYEAVKDSILFWLESTELILKTKQDVENVVKDALKEIEEHNSNLVLLEVF